MLQEKPVEVLNLELLKVSNLPELQGWKDKQEALVKENPFVEIIDNKTFEVAKQSRTALLKGRTSLEAQEKAIASKLASFRKDVGTETQKLIDITLPHETKQQAEVKRFEDIKENERLERERLEAERVAKIKAKIESFESECLAIIQTSTIENVNLNKQQLDDMFNSDCDFEEFEILYETAKQRIQNLFDSKCSDIQEKENQRIENERLKAEKEAFGKKLRELELQQENERKEREEKELQEKQQMFEIRKSRLAEIGMVFHNNCFLEDNGIYPVHKDVVFNDSSLAFEDFISERKLEIQKRKDEAEAELQKQAELKAENEAKEKAEIERKKKIEKENKARVKRLANDKEIIAKSLETYFADLHLETENEETKNFIDAANVQIQHLKSILLTQLNNL